MRRPRFNLKAFDLTHPCPHCGHKIPPRELRHGAARALRFLDSTLEPNTVLFLHEHLSASKAYEVFAVWQVVRGLKNIAPDEFRDVELWQRQLDCAYLALSFPAHPLQFR